MTKDKPQHTRAAIEESIGDISAYEVLHNQLLVGTYIKPEVTKSGLYLTDQSRKEDEYQGKVGVVLKKGPLAFKDDGSARFHGQDVDTGEWIVYRAANGRALEINGVHCRLVDDIHVEMRVPAPEAIY